MKDNYRKSFPILSDEFNQELIYLDNTATTQKPDVVINAMSNFLKYENATVHRGIYGLSQKATDRCESIRSLVQTFIGAKRPEEIIFTKGTTESINLVAQTFGKTFLAKGDEIIITEMEHHANIVPWQEICKDNGAHLKVVPVDDLGDLKLNVLKELLNPKTKMVAFMHISNVLGTVNPVDEIIKMIRLNSQAKILIDGAQAVSHIPVNVSQLDCDFYVFSGHKMYGPTGIGVLYGKYDCLCELPPYQTGGEMIELVSFEKTTFALPPARFEAGTPPINEIIGLGECLKFIKEIGLDNIEAMESELLEYATAELEKIDVLKIIGTSSKKAATISFTIKGIHPHDIGQFLDEKGIAIRVGHHCAQPLMKRYNVPATARASFSFYNLKEEVDALVIALREMIDYFQ